MRTIQTFFSALFFLSSAVLLIQANDENKNKNVSAPSLSSSSSFDYKFLYHLSQLKLQDSELNKANGLVLFAQNRTMCRLYSADCLVYVLLNKEQHIDECSLRIRSSDEEKMTVKLVVPCDDKTNNDLSKNNIVCPSFDSFLSEQSSSSKNSSSKLELESKYEMFAILMETELVGEYDITFKLNSRKASDSLKQVFTQLEYPILIKEPLRIMDLVFKVYIWTFIIFISACMGIILDIESLKKILTMPKPVIIGLTCQYLMMPLVAFAFSRVLDLPVIEALALFLYGCCPGGSGSNNWTILLDGDIDLSAIMTFFSTLSSLVMMPVWIYSLGSILTTEAEIQIPMLGLFMNLMITIVPCLCGLALTLKFPKLKKAAIKIIKPLTLFVIITMLAIMFTTKIYIFKLISARNWLGPPLIPWIGMFGSGLIAWCLRLEWRQVKTVGIETGIQNGGIAMLIILANFPSPQADYAITSLFSIFLLCPVPLYIALIVRKIRGQKSSQYKDVKTTYDGKEMKEIESKKAAKEQEEADREEKASLNSLHA
jgi:bile acid transporter